jgi:transketolase
LGWDEPPFVIPADVKAAWDARERGARLEADWRARFAAYRTQHPDLAAEFERRMNGELPAKWSEHAAKVVDAISTSAKPMATRKSSQVALEAFAPILPELVGGSADLTGSNNTLHKYSKLMTPSDPAGN